MAGTWPSARRRPSVPSPEYFSLEQPRLKIFRRAGAPAPIPRWTRPQHGTVDTTGPASERTRRGNRAVPGILHAARRPRGIVQSPRGATAGPVVDRDTNRRSRLPHSVDQPLGAPSPRDPHHGDRRRSDPPYGPGPVWIAARRYRCGVAGEPSTAVYHMPDRVMDDDGRDLLIAVRSLAEENQPANEAVLEVVEITSLARQLRAEVAESRATRGPRRPPEQPHRSRVGRPARAASGQRRPGYRDRGGCDPPTKSS